MRHVPFAAVRRYAGQYLADWRSTPNYKEAVQKHRDYLNRGPSYLTRQNHHQLQRRTNSKNDLMKGKKDSMQYGLEVYFGFMLERLLYRVVRLAKEFYHGDDEKVRITGEELQKAYKALRQSGKIFLQNSYPDDGAYQGDRKTLQDNWDALPPIVKGVFPKTFHLWKSVLRSFDGDMDVQIGRDFYLHFKWIGRSLLRNLVIEADISRLYHAYNYRLDAASVKYNAPNRDRYRIMSHYLRKVPCFMTFHEFRPGRRVRDKDEYRVWYRLDRPMKDRYHAAGEEGNGVRWYPIRVKDLEAIRP